MRVLVLLMSLGACAAPAEPSTTTSFQHITDPEVAAGVTEALVVLAAQLDITPRAANRIQLRVQLVESLRPTVRPGGARALAELRDLVLAGAAFDRDVVIAEREVQP